MRKFKKIVALIAVLCMVMSAVLVSAANKTIATKTFTNVGTISSMYHQCTNYDSKLRAVSKGYLYVTMKFNSKFQKYLSNFCDESGTAKSVKNYCTIMPNVPSSVTLKDSDNSKWGWTNKNCCKSTKAVVKLIDTNGDKCSDKAVITVYAYGKSGYSILVGSKTVKLVKCGISVGYRVETKNILYPSKTIKTATK